MAATTAAFAASLAQMAAAFAATDAAGEPADPAAAALVERTERLRREALVLGDADGTVYGAVLAATSPDERREALQRATDVPLQLVEVARDIAQAGAVMAVGGRAALRGDAKVAAILAAAAARAAAHLVRCNVDAGELDPALADRADAFAMEAGEAAGGSVGGQA